MIVNNPVAAGDNHRIGGRPTFYVTTPSRSSSTVTPTNEVAGPSLVSINASSILTLATFGGSSSAVSSDTAGQSLPVVVLAQMHVIVRACVLVLASIC